MGTWTTPDAFAREIGDPTSQKSFMWIRNNPANYSDPTGFNLCVHYSENDVGGEEVSTEHEHPIELPLELVEVAEAAADQDLANSRITLTQDSNQNDTQYESAQICTKTQLAGVGDHWS